MIWLIIMIPVSALFTGLGIYAMKRKEPMWFWSGSSVDEKDITDVAAYNRANGIMWLCFSGLFWIAAILGFLKRESAGPFLGAGCLLGVLLLPFVYGKIYKKYRKQ